MEKLRRIGWIATKSRSRDVDVGGGHGAALCFIKRLPVLHMELARRGTFPSDLPVTDALLAVEVAGGGHQFIADASLKLTGRQRRRWHGTSFNTRHLKFSCKNLHKAAHGRPQFLQECISPKCRFS